MPASDSSLALASGQSDWFTTTHWSLVLAAGQGDSPAAQQALERLCQTYWYPLYTFVRRQGYSPEDAQDRTQAFFERVLEKNYFGQVARDKGRFRAFLLACLKHFLSNERARERAAKRGGGKTVFSLDAQQAEERYHLEPAEVTSPDKLYERRWASTVWSCCWWRAWWAAPGRRCAPPEPSASKAGCARKRREPKRMSRTRSDGLKRR